MAAASELAPLGSAVLGSGAAGDSGIKGAAQVVRRADIERATNAFMKAVELLYDVKLLPKAEQLMSDAIYYRPRNAQWYMGRGQVYRAMGKYHLALYDFNSVVKLEPRNAPCYCLRSVCLRKLRKYAAALADMNTALQLEPDNSAFRFYRALILLDVEEYGPAIEDFAAASENERYAFKARLHRAICHERMGNFPDATADLAALVRLEPHNTAGYDALAALLMRHGHYHEALQQLNAATPFLGVSSYPPSLLLARRSEANFALQRYRAALHDAQLAVAAASNLHLDAAGQASALKPLAGDVPTDPTAPASTALNPPSNAYAVALGDIIMTRDTAYLLLRRGLAYLACGQPLAALPDLLYASLACDVMVKRAETRDPTARRADADGGDGKEKDGSGSGRDSSRKRSRRATSASAGGGARSGAGAGGPGGGASVSSSAALFGGAAQLESLETLASELAQSLGELGSEDMRRLYGAAARLTGGVVAVGGANSGVPPPSAATFSLLSLAGGMGMGPDGSPLLTGAGSPPASPAMRPMASPTGTGAGGASSRGGTRRGTAAVGAGAGAGAAVSSRDAPTSPAFGAAGSAGAAGGASAGAGAAAAASGRGASGSAGAGAGAGAGDDPRAAPAPVKPPRMTAYGPAVNHSGLASDAPEAIMHDDEESFSDIEAEIRCTFNVPADRVGRGRRRSINLQMKDLQLGGAGGGARDGKAKDDDDDEDGMGSPTGDGGGAGAFSPDATGGAGRAAALAYESALTAAELELRRKGAALARRSVRSRLFRAQTVALGSSGTLVSLTGAGGSGGAGSGAGAGASVSSGSSGGGPMSLSAHVTQILAQAAAAAGGRPTALTRQGALLAALCSPRPRTRAPLAAARRPWPSEPAPWRMPTKSRELALLVSQVQLGLGLAYANLRHYVRSRVHLQRAIIAYPANVAALLAESQVERALRLSGPADVRLTALLQLAHGTDVASELLRPSLRVLPFHDLVAAGGTFIPSGGASAYVMGIGPDLLMTYSKRFVAAAASHGAGGARGRRRGASPGKSAAVPSGSAAALAGTAAGSGGSRPRGGSGAGTGELFGPGTGSGAGYAHVHAGDGLEAEEQGLEERLVPAGGAGSGSGASSSEASVTDLAMAGAPVVGYRVLIRRYLRAVLGRSRKLAPRAKLSSAVVELGPAGAKAAARASVEAELEGEGDGDSGVSGAESGADSPRRKGKGLGSGKGVPPLALPGVGGPLLPVSSLPAGAGRSLPRNSSGGALSELSKGSARLLRAAARQSQVQSSSRSVASTGGSSSYDPELDHDSEDDVPTDEEDAGHGAGGGAGDGDASPTLTAGTGTAAGAGAGDTSFDADGDTSTVRSGTTLTLDYSHTGPGMGAGGGDAEARSGSMLAHGSAATGSTSGALQPREALEREEASQRRESSMLWTQDPEAEASVIRLGLASAIAMLPPGITRVDATIRRPALAALLPAPEDAEGVAEADGKEEDKEPADADADAVDDDAGGGAGASGSGGGDTSSAGGASASAPGDGPVAAAGGAAGGAPATGGGADASKAAAGGAGKGAGGAGAGAGSSAGPAGRGPAAAGAGAAGAVAASGPLAWTPETQAGGAAGRRPGTGTARSTSRRGGRATESKEGKDSSASGDAGDGDDDDDSDGDGKAGTIVGSEGGASGHRASRSRAGARSREGMSSVSFARSGTAGGASSGGFTASDYASTFAEPAHYDAETARVRAYVLTLRGMVRQGLQAHHEAVADFEAAIAADPRLGDIHIHRAVSQLALGQPDAAVAGCSQALALGSDAAVANDKLGQARRQQGEHELAVEAFTAALAHHPDYPPYLSRRAAALRTLGRLDEASADLSKALAVMGGQDPRLLRQRAEVMARQNRFSEAISDYRDALRALGWHPRHAADIHFHAGVCAANLDRYPDALSHFDAALEALARVQPARRLAKLAERYQTRLRGPSALVLMTPPGSSSAMQAGASASAASTSTSRGLVATSSFVRGAPQSGRPGTGPGAHGVGTLSAPGEPTAGGAGGVAPGSRGSTAGVAHRGSTAGVAPGSAGGPRAPQAQAASRPGGSSSSLSHEELRGMYTAAQAAGMAPAAVASAMTTAVFASSTLAQKRAAAEAAEAAQPVRDMESMRYGSGAGSLGFGSPLHGNIAFVAERRRLLRVLSRAAEALNRRAPDAFLPLLRAALHHERAKALQMLGRHSEALTDFTLVLAHSPTSAHATFRRAFSARALKHYVAAGDDFETAAALCPSDERFAVNYNGLGDVTTIVLCAAGEEPHTDVAGALAAVNAVARSRSLAHGFGGHGVGFEPIDGLVDDGAL